MFPIKWTYPGCRYHSIGLLTALFFFIVVPCQADLRGAPAWFDDGAPGNPPDWHYRVPVSLPSTTPGNSTIRVDVDFDALLSDLGISGTFDGRSPRIVRNDGLPVATQQFTDAVYMGATDALGNGRGEVRFIHQTGGSDTYYLYFDITQNGTKPAWPSADTINGNFEFGAAGDRNIAGWTVNAAAGFDAQLRPSENPSINSDTTGADTPFVTTDGTPHSGQFSYLLGSRSQNEPGDTYPAVTLSRDIDVAAANPGDLTIRYRVEGWDSSADGAGQYDFIRIRLIGSSTAELVGPDAGNYGVFPFSPNYGTQPVSSSQSGYGRYNGWDTDTAGGRHYTPPMAWTPGSQPWFQISTDLSAFAGQTVTLEITSSHYNQYRSWVHVDDVAWSVTAGTLGSPQAFGANVTAPTTAAAGSILALVAVMDAQPSAVIADIRDAADAVVASGILLYDDGSHGDLVAGDGQWANDGSDPGSPTATIPAGTTVGAQWKTVLYALDGSGSLVSPTDGLVHIQGQGTAETQANFYNIDEQIFTIVEAVVNPPASGNKHLYLTTTDDLSRTPPTAVQNVRIRTYQSNSWALTPALQQPLTISAGTTSVPVRLMISRPNLGSGDRSTEIDIELSGIGALNDEPITVGGSVLEYNFAVPVSATPPFTLGAGTAPALTVRTTNRAIRVYTTYGGTHSQVRLDVDTVINVDSVAFYDAAYPAGSALATARPGETVFLRAMVSDPFGSFDITGADVEITGPSGTINASMTEVLDDGAASKTYEYSLVLPAIGSDGTWTAVVTAAEGTEGTITHQGTASLPVGAPLLTVLKSANSATAGPGDLITYTVQVINTGTGTALNIELDDAMSPYTALRIAYDGSDPMPFRLVSAPGGLSLGSPVYSDDGGTTYGYGPLVSGGGGASAGYDANVSHWRLPMTGMLGGNGEGFTVRYQVVVK